MKKFFFIFCAILFSTTAFSDDLIFRMFNTTSTNSTNTNSGSTLNLSNYYYFYVGGSAYVYNGSTSGAKLIDGGVARIMHKDSYIQINLPSGYTVQAGDVIKYDGTYESKKNIYLHKKGGDSAGGRSGAVKVNGNRTAYTVKSTDVIVGASTIYINLGGKDNLGKDISLNYVSYFTITRPSELVKFYAFDEMAAENNVSSSTNQYELVPGELYLNSDGRTGSTANSIKSTSGKPNAIYMNGPGENLATLLRVTDPCQIKVWGWSAGQKLGVSCGSYDAEALDTTIVINGYGKTNNMNLGGSYNYNGYEDSTTIYIGPISTSSSAFYIAAIRVEYPRIRPAANFSVSPTEATLKVGESQVFTCTKDYEGAVIARGKTDNSDDSWVLGTDVDSVTVEVTALEAGAGQVYTLKLAQVADAYCRGAEVEVPITIEELSTPTGLDNSEWSREASKVLRNGQLLILRDGKVFNAQGIEVK